MKLETREIYQLNNNNTRSIKSHKYELMKQSYMIEQWLLATI